MTYVVVKNFIGDIKYDWLEGNFGCSAISELDCNFGFSGQGWNIIHSCYKNADGKFVWITTGRFSNKEHAVLFNLRWP